MAISIIIPTFNRATIIPNTLDSIINQSYSDWECYVVDDHSLDNTKDVVTSYIQKDSRFHYLTNSRKKGAQGARNTGLFQCNSEWVYFFDSDNQLHSDCLEELAKRINDDIDIIQCFSQVLQVETCEKLKVFNWKNNGNVHDAILFAQSYTDFNHAIIRRTALLEIGGLDEDCPCMQEWDTHIRLSQKSRYTTVEKILVDYYVGAADAISSNPKRDVVGKLFILSKYIEEWRKQPRRLKRYVFYLMTLIRKQKESSFKKESYSKLKSLVPKWYVVRGAALSRLLEVRQFFLNK